MLKHFSVTARAEKFGKYGLYNNNTVLWCHPCGKKMDRAREVSLLKHNTTDLRDTQCAKDIHGGIKFLPALGYKQREERRKLKAKEAKGHIKKKSKHQYVAWKWDEESY